MPQHPGDKALLISHLYTPGNTSQCLEFWYHMFGNTVGTLNVYFMNSGIMGNPVFTLSGILKVNSLESGDFLNNSVRCYVTLE